VVPGEPALVTGLQARLHYVYVRPGPEQAPAVAQEGQQGEDDHPDRPEGTTGSAGKPHGDAHKRCRGRDTCLLDQATAQVRLALHQSGPCRHGTDGQVGAQSVEVRPRASRVDRAETFVELLRGEPAGDGVLVQLLHEVFALGVGYSNLTRIRHIKNVVGVASKDMSAEDDFDLSAAGLRADGSDLRISVAVLASKLESSLPARTRVERRGGGLLGRGEKHVRRVEVSLGESSYELTVEGDRVRGSRERKVGGIAIKREELDAGQWVSELAAQLREEAQRSAEARAALEKLVG
jgi:hypothetical protein